MTFQPTLSLSGAARLIFIVGDPIAQVKSPATISAQLQARGMDAWCLPAQVGRDDFTAWMSGVRLMRNVDGLIITVPHKFAVLPFCTALSDRARFLGAANVLRRLPNGGWLGDHCDGAGWVLAMTSKGLSLNGRRVLLVGAGGAGSAIAHSVLDHGAHSLVVADTDGARQQRLVQSLSNWSAQAGKGLVMAGLADGSGFDIIINATPLGMRPDDPLPLALDHISAQSVVACVITAPTVTPLIQAARDKGCATITGSDMFAGVSEYLVMHLMGDETCTSTKTP